MLYLKKKNNRSRLSFYKIEKSRVLSKFVVCYSQNKKIKSSIQTIKKIKFFQCNFFNEKSRVRLNNRCIFTIRSNSVYKKYNSSRFILREFIQFGMIPGFKKAVW
jgi:ribosomal protein S14